MSAVNDGDHVIAIFNQDGHWGAVSKSNTSALSHIPLISSDMTGRLNIADQLLKDAVFLGANENGLYKA